MPIHNAGLGCTLIMWDLHKLEEEIPHYKVNFNGTAKKK